MKKFLFLLMIIVLLLASTYCYLIRPLTEQVGSLKPLLPVEANIFNKVEMDEGKEDQAHYLPFLSGAIIAGILSLIMIFSGIYKIAEEDTDNRALVVAGVAYVILTVVLVGLVFGLDLML